MNYTQLNQYLREYLENEEPTFVSLIPEFVRQAEMRIYRSVLLPEFRRNAVSSTAAGNPYLARPADFLSVFSMAVVDASGVFHFLYDKDMNFIREAYPSVSTTGRPRYYAQFVGSGPESTAGSFLLGPTPDAAYEVHLQYYYNPPSIVDTGTSWLGTNAPTALLYGAILEGYTFLKGSPDMFAVYQKRYDEALAQLGLLDVRSKRDSYRDGDMRVE